MATLRACGSISTSVVAGDEDAVDSAIAFAWISIGVERVVASESCDRVISNHRGVFDVQGAEDSYG